MEKYASKEAINIQKENYSKIRKINHKQLER